jgi:hypothetical protein
MEIDAPQRHSRAVTGARSGQNGRPTRFPPGIRPCKAISCAAVGVRSAPEWTWIRIASDRRALIALLNHTPPKNSIACAREFKQFEARASAYHYFIAHSGCLSNSVRSPVRSNVLEVGVPVRNGVKSMETVGTLSRPCRNWMRSGSVLPT